MSDPLQSSLATAALEAAPFGVLILDLDQHICWMNATAEEFLDVEAERLLGRGLDGLAGGELAYLSEHKEFVSVPMGADTRWLKCWHLPLRIDNRIAGEIYFYIDITEYRQIRAERDQLAEDLSRQSMRDSVTGLPNRRGLLAALEPQVSRSRRYGNPLALIRLQIDDIDQLDGRHGASTVDRVMLTIGQLLRDRTRWADLIGCFDAGEFLLVMPETTKGIAVQLAEKFCGWIGGLKITVKDDSTITVVARCGVTEWMRGDDSAKMLRRTLQALKYIKNSTKRFVSAL